MLFKTTRTLQNSLDMIENHIIADKEKINSAILNINKEIEEIEKIIFSKIESKIKEKIKYYIDEDCIEEILKVAHSIINIEMNVKAKMGVNDINLSNIPRLNIDMWFKLIYEIMNNFLTVKKMFNQIMIKFPTVEKMFKETKFPATQSPHPLRSDLRSSAPPTVTETEQPEEGVTVEVTGDESTKPHEKKTRKVKFASQLTDVGGLKKRKPTKRRRQTKRRRPTKRRRHAKRRKQTKKNL